MFSVADWGRLFNVPVISALVTTLTPVVVTLNVALDCPGFTVTEEGTVATGSPLERATTIGFDPAGPPSVTVPVERFPPTTVDGFKLTDDRIAGTTVRVAVCLRPGNAVMFAKVCVFTGVVVTVNVALV